MLGMDMRALAEAAKENFQVRHASAVALLDTDTPKKHVGCRGRYSFRCQGDRP